MAIPGEPREGVPSEADYWKKDPSQRKEERKQRPDPYDRRQFYPGDDRREDRM